MEAIAFIATIVALGFAPVDTKDPNREELVRVCKDMERDRMSRL